MASGLQPRLASNYVVKDDLKFQILLLLLPTLTPELGHVPLRLVYESLGIMHARQVFYRLSYIPSSVWRVIVSFSVLSARHREKDME